MKKFLIVITPVVIIFLLAILFTNLYILKNKKYIYSDDLVSTTTLGLVFGGGMRADGSMSPMQADRVSEGVLLFKTGKVERLMMTGDDGGMRDDEVDAMKAMAVADGVPMDKVTTDPHGYRTYESCYREANIYGIKKVIAVSQTFHLPRIIYLCKNFGIDTVGVASDFRDYKYDSFYMNVREVGARLKAWWQVVISKPLPMKLSKN